MIFDVATKITCDMCNCQGIGALGLEPYHHNVYRHGIYPEAPSLQDTIVLFKLYTITEPHGWKKENTYLKNEPFKFYCTDCKHKL